MANPSFFLCVDGAYIEHRKILLLKRAIEPYKGFWGFVGGHVEADAAPEEALIREFKEETNLEVTVGKLLGTRIERTPDRVKSILTFEVASAKGEIVLNAENTEYRWFRRIPKGCVYDYSKYLTKELDSKPFGPVVIKATARVCSQWQTRISRPSRNPVTSSF